MVRIAVSAFHAVATGGFWHAQTACQRVGAQLRTGSFGLAAVEKEGKTPCNADLSEGKRSLVCSCDLLFVTWFLM